MATRILRYIGVGSLVISLVLIWLVLRKPSLPTLETSSEAAKSFDEKAGQLARVQEQGMLGEVRFTEAEINSKIREALQSNPPPAGPATLKEAAVRLEGESVLAMLTLNVKGKALYVTMRGNLGFSNHVLQLIPSEVRIGSLPVPASILGGKFDARVEVPESVTAVRVENSELVVQAQ